MTDTTTRIGARRYVVASALAVLIGFVQRRSWPLVGGKLVTPHCGDPGNGQTADFPQAAYEYECASHVDESTFHLQFPSDVFALSMLEGARVLDLGCGWGGKVTFWSETVVRATWIGVEPYHHVCRAARGFASSRLPEPPAFVAAAGEQLPFAGGSFDFILCDDVLEHVRDPQCVLQEMARVLSPGGRIVLRFPPYRGLRSHHLLYATKLPFIHNIFHPETVMLAMRLRRAVDPVGTRGYPHDLQPARSYQGRVTLPTLNGTNLEDFQRALTASSLKVRYFHLRRITEDTRVIRNQGSRAAKLINALLNRLPGFPPDLWATSIHAVLELPDAQQR